MSQCNEQQLAAANVVELDIWESLFPAKFPNRIGSELRAALIHQGQLEKNSKTVFREIDRRLQSLVTRPEKTDVHNRLGGTGTRLIRTWHGVRHEVTLLAKGFSYRGRAYRSLSEIARLITGARWSGPRFFGLKEQK